MESYQAGSQQKTPLQRGTKLLRTGGIKLANGAASKYSGVHDASGYRARS